MQNFECEITESNVTDEDGNLCSSFGLYIKQGTGGISFPDLCADRNRIVSLISKLDEYPGDNVISELFDDFIFS